MRAGLLLALLLLSPTPASAFDNHTAFGESTLLGGGGGRYFTGSPRDGYSCAVCHTGGVAPEEVSLIPADPSLFDEGYQPLVSYRVEVPLPDATASALTLEIVDLNGDGAGQLALLPDDEQGDADRCATPTPEPVSAAYVVALPSDGRQVAVLDVCGAERLRFEWTAPAEGAGPVFLNAAVVAADGTGAPDGDGTIVIEQVIPRVGESYTPETITVGCAAAPGRGGVGSVGILLFGWVVGRLRRLRG